MRKSYRSTGELADFYDDFRAEVEKFGAKVLSADEIYAENDDLSAFELDSVRRNFLVDFGEYGFHLPEFDRVIYDAETYDVLAVIFSSSDIAWGIAESAYWKLKYNSVHLTKHIKVYFVMTGRDVSIKESRTLSSMLKFKRELDGCYTLGASYAEEDELQPLDDLLDDVKHLVDNTQKVMI